MKNRKSIIFILLIALLVTCIGPVSVIADDPKPNKVTKIIKPSTTIRVGDKFELNAILSPYDADDDYLRWQIVGKKGIVRFDDDGTDDDEMELVALKAGKTKIRCSVSGKGKKYSKTVTITVKKAKKASTKISRVGAKTITVEAGDDFELKVKKGKGVSNSHLKWTIKKTSIVKYDDYDRYGTEIELEAKKPGTTKIICRNTKTNKKIKYTVKVVPDYDDDDDDYDYD